MTGDDDELVKTDLLVSQSAVTKIDCEKLKCNTEQFQSLQTTVDKCTAENTIQSEMKSYSSILAEKPQPAIISRETLKKSFSSSCVRRRSF
jgi:hypothetical protein